MGQRSIFASKRAINVVVKKDLPDTVGFAGGRGMSILPFPLGLVKKVPRIPLGFFAIANRKLSKDKFAILVGPNSGVNFTILVCRG